MAEQPTLSLTAPIEAHGETISILTFRPPTGRDIRECGLPFVLGQSDAGHTSKFDGATIARYISKLAGIPTSSVDKLSAPDFLAATGIIGGFFAEAPADGS